MVADQTEGLGFSGIKSALDVSSHVLVQHGNDILPIALVLSENVLGAEQAGFLTGIPVEFNGIGSATLGHLGRLHHSAQGLEDGHGTGSVIVSSRGRIRGPFGDAVQVGAHDDDVVRLSRDGHNDAGLLEVVFDLLDSGALYAGISYDLVDLVEKPIGRLDTGVGLVVPVVVRRELREAFLQTGG